MAMLAYLAVRGGGPGPLFRFTDGRCLSRDRFVTHVRTALSIVPYMQGIASALELQQQQPKEA